MSPPYTLVAFVSLLGLQQTFVDILIVPNVIITPLFYGSTSLTDSPQCLRNWCRIIKVNIGEFLLDGIGGNLSFVVWDGRVEVMRNMGRANFVMEEVNYSPRIEFVVGTINCMECTPHEVVIIISEVWNVNVSMLKPRCKGLLGREAIQMSMSVFKRKTKS